MTNKLAIIQKKITPLVHDSLEFTIVKKQDLVIGTELLSKLNKLNDAIKAEKEKVTKPLNEALKAERNRWRPIEDAHTTAIEHIRSVMTEYQTEQVRIQREEEMKIASRIKNGRGNLSIESAVAKIDAMEKAEKEIATSEGLVQFRETQVLKVTDESLIPREYLMINESAVLKALKEGKIVPGAEIEIRQTPVNYR